MKRSVIGLRNLATCSPRQSAFGRILLPLVCFGLAPISWAVSPAPDGGYPGGNTAEGGSGALFSLTTGSNNTALGSQTLYSITTGKQNTATGAQALKNNRADNNTADGFQALVNNTIGLGNTAAGWRALFQNGSGDRNTAQGNGALYRNTVGSDNTATGFQALYNNMTGSRNAAYGSQALLGGGNDNTAIGSGALAYNPSSDRNTAVGSGALALNMEGNDNTATGAGALGCFNGSDNTANGANALVRCRPTSSGGGSNNTVMGAGAFSSGDSNDIVQDNTVIGAQALPLSLGGNNNIAIGYRAGANLPFGDSNIEIGNVGQPAGEEGATIRIGDVQMRAFIAGIYGTTTGSATTLPVIVDVNGQLGTVASSKRFKKDIKAIDNASQSIFALNPVSFHYKADKTNAPQLGLIAEEVEKVNPDLVVRDKEGKPFTVRYDAVNAMLLNEFLKEHHKIEEQQTLIEQLKSNTADQEITINDLKRDTGNLTAQLKEQASQIQRLSATLQRAEWPHR